MIGTSIASFPLYLVLNSIQDRLLLFSAIECNFRQIWVKRCSKIERFQEQLCELSISIKSSILSRLELARFFSNSCWLLIKTKIRQKTEGFHNTNNLKSSNSKIIFKLRIFMNKFHQFLLITWGHIIFFINNLYKKLNSYPLKTVAKQTIVYYQMETFPSQGHKVQSLGCQPQNLKVDGSNLSKNCYTFPLR